MKKGQFSIEFIVVLGALLVILASVSMPLYRNSKEDAKKLRDMTRAREAANKLAGALNAVYSGGVGAKQTIEYSLPEDVGSIRIGKGVDGADEKPPDNRMDVQVWFDWEGDNIVAVNTLLPSENHENWGGFPIIDNIENIDPGYQRVEVEYKYPDAGHEHIWIELKVIE